MSELLFIIIIFFFTKSSTSLYPNCLRDVLVPGQFGYKQVDNLDVNKKTIKQIAIQTFDKHPGSGNFFWDWWTLVGTGWYQRHTRKMILKKKKY